MVPRLVRLDGHDLLDKVGDALRAATDLLAHVVKLLEAARPRDDLFRSPEVCEVDFRSSEVDMKRSIFYLYVIHSYSCSSSRMRTTTECEMEPQQLEATTV